MWNCIRNHGEELLDIAPKIEKTPKKRTAEEPDSSQNALSKHMIRKAKKKRQTKVHKQLG